MRLPFAIGAVVDGLLSTFQTPLSGQVSPVCERVPTGHRVVAFIVLTLGSGIAFAQIQSKYLAVRAEDELLYPIESGRLPSANSRSGGGAVSAAPPFAFSAIAHRSGRRKPKRSRWSKFELHFEG